MQQLSSTKLGVHGSVSGLAQVCRSECSGTHGAGPVVPRACFVPPDPCLEDLVRAPDGLAGPMGRGFFHAW
jgi:hypothetical protein